MDAPSARPLYAAASGFGFRTSTSAFRLGKCVTTAGYFEELYRVNPPVMSFPGMLTLSEMRTPL